MHPTADKQIIVRKWRVKPAIKISVIVLSILSLSLFFEGWRQVKVNLTPVHLALLFAGAVMTVLFLWVQAFWIYAEEKEKGTLKKKIGHFDNLLEFLTRKGGNYSD